MFEIESCAKQQIQGFELNRTASSDGCEQKLGNNLCHDSELITTKVCSQIGSK